MCQWLITDTLGRIEEILLLRITIKEPPIFNILVHTMIFKVFALLLTSCLFTLRFYYKVRLQHFEVNANYKTEIT